MAARPCRLHPTRHTRQHRGRLGNWRPWQQRFQLLQRAGIAAAALWKPISGATSGRQWSGGQRLRTLGCCGPDAAAACCPAGAAAVAAAGGAAGTAGATGVATQPSTAEQARDFGAAEAAAQAPAGGGAAEPRNVQAGEACWLCKRCILLVSCRPAAAFKACPHLT